MPTFEGQPVERHSFAGTPVERRSFAGTPAGGGLVSRIGSAFTDRAIEGFGDDPVGLNTETILKLRESGLFDETVLGRLNEAIGVPTIAAADLALGS